MKNSGNRVVIVQSNYLPWKGYFDLINSGTHFVIFDEVQYTRRDWRNRNKIKTERGLSWLTVPVEVKGKYLQKISETKVVDKGWAACHWSSLTHSYAKAPYFHEYKTLFSNLFKKAAELELLSDVNRMFLREICSILGIKTVFCESRDFQLLDGKTERLLGICQSLDAECYISGPAAKGYLDENLFAENGIKVEWYDYSNYPEYPQLYPPFDHGVSVLDLLFSVGPASPQFMKSFDMSGSGCIE